MSRQNMTKYYEKNVNKLTKWQPSCPWPDGPMARPSVLPALTWAKILGRHQHLHGTMRSFEDKSFKCFNRVMLKYVENPHNFPR